MATRSSRRAIRRFAGLTLAAVAIACSGSSSTGLIGPGSAGSSGSEGPGAASGNSGGPASNSAGGTAGSGGTTTGTGGAGDASVSGSEDACASEVVRANAQALDLYIMLDQSGSMAESTGGGQSKWAAVTNALRTFFGQPSAAGVGVGLQYFGLAAAGDGGPGNASSCQASDYAKPEIEIATLPGVSQALSSSLAAHTPKSDTPTLPALQGAVDHAKAWAEAHAGHTAVVVLATDGQPSSANCVDDLQRIDEIAAAAAAGTPKILTFVIGVGTSLASLNGIASAGGTGHAFLLDTGGNVDQQFLDAMNKIRGAALGCQYPIPQPNNGGTLDYATLQVRYTPGAGGPAETIPRVADKAACPTSSDAWYFDDNTTPTVIRLCDSVCTKVSADAAGQIDIVVRC